MPSDLLQKRQEDLIEINLYYKSKKNNSNLTVFIPISEEDGKKALERGDENVDVLTTKWVPQNWTMNNSIVRESKVYNSITGESDIDWTVYQNKLIEYCLRDWNMYDESGNPVPPTIENVGNLPVNIVGEMIRLYDQTLSTDEEEKKELPRQQ